MDNRYSHRCLIRMLDDTELIIGVPAAHKSVEQLANEAAVALSGHLGIAGELIAESGKLTPAGTWLAIPSSSVSWLAFEAIEPAALVDPDLADLAAAGG